MAIFPIYKFLKNPTGVIVRHDNSSQEWPAGSTRLLDEIELYRVCDTQMQTYLENSVSAGGVSGLDYYESVSGTDDGIDIQFFPYPESFDRLCNAAFGTPFRGNPCSRTLVEEKQFTTKDTQRAIEESFPVVQETVSGVGVTRTSTTRVIEFDSPIAFVQKINEFRSKVIINPAATGVGKGFTLDFLNNGSNIKNKWLDYEGANIFGDDTPGMLPLDSVLESMVFTNRDDNINIDIEVWVGFSGSEVLVKTWELRECRYFFSASIITENISVGPGVPVKVFMNFAGNPTPVKCVVCLHFISTSEVLEEVCIPSDPPP